MSELSLQRRFAVHGMAEAGLRARHVEAVSFEDAALAYLDGHDAAADEVSLYVEDCETGEQQCFRVDVETGATHPCD